MKLIDICVDGKSVLSVGDSMRHPNADPAHSRNTSGTTVTRYPLVYAKGSPDLNAVISQDELVRKGNHTQRPKAKLGRYVAPPDPGRLIHGTLRVWDDSIPQQIVLAIRETPPQPDSAKVYPCFGTRRGYRVVTKYPNSGGSRCVVVTRDLAIRQGYWIPPADFVSPYFPTWEPKERASFELGQR